jgi:polyisoprenoid-binding protein YceI
MRVGFGTIDAELACRKFESREESRRKAAESSRLEPHLTNEGTSIMLASARIGLAAAFALAVFGAANAQDATPSKDPAAAPAGTYKLDKNHASVTGTILRAGLSHYTFRFDKLDGNFDYDPKNPEASKVTVTIDPASLDSNTAAIDHRIEGNEFFDAVKFPQITFVSTSIKRTAGNKGTMTGDLSFVGFTKPVTLDVTFNGVTAGKRATMGFSATTTIKIADFGPVLSAFIKAHNLGDEVPLAIEVLFDKAA